MAYLIAIIGTMVFVVFLCFTTMLLNEAVKQSQKYRHGRMKSHKVKHSVYTVCYSFIFSSMLIVSVYFPFFIVGTCGNFGDVRVTNPFPAVRQSIISETEQAYQQPFNSNYNVFNEINKTIQRFNNDDIFK